MKLKFLAKLAVFSALFLAIAIPLGMLVTPKWTETDSDWEPATRMAEGFYDEPKGSLDVLYLGSSLVYRGISPVVMWEKYGFTGYVLGSSVQRMWISYYYLEEALKSQSPKVVVLNMNGITDDTPNDEDRNRKALDYMELSPTKLEAVRASLSKGESFLSYLLPLLRFHSRWDSLGEEDFTHFSADRHYFAKGQDLQFETTSYHPAANWLQATDAVAREGDKAGGYFDRIVRLCRDRGISLLLIDMPSPVRFRYDVHNLSESLAKQYGLPYLDFNLKTDEFGLDWETDLRDAGVHLNVAGAEKFSAYLGAFLQERYSLGGTASEAVKSLWDRDAQDYEQEKADYALSREQDFAEYLKKLRDPDFLTVVSVKGYISVSLAPEQLAALRALGLETDFSGKKNWSYLAVLDGEPVLEESSAQPLSARKELEGLAVEAQSGGWDAGNVADIRIDRTEYALNQPGFNIVVYDKRFRRVADRVSFDVDRAQAAQRPAAS